MPGAEPRGDPAGGAQRRRRPRTAYRAWVELTIEGRRARARAHDLGAGGLGLELRDGAPARSEAVVSEFALPGIALPLEVRGRVAWADAGGSRCGIRFQDVDAGIAELIESFVAGRL